jgi:hypothetical protein
LPETKRLGHGMVATMDHVRNWLIALDWSAPLPAGVFTAVIIWIVARRRFFLAVAATALAGFGWWASVNLGILGLAAASALVAWGFTHTRRERRRNMIAAGLLPIGVAWAAKVWAEPNSSAAWPVNHPIQIGVALLTGVAVLLLVKRLLRPELDPVRFATPAMRSEVSARDGNVCKYCSASGDTLGVELQLDHVIPWSKGGPTNPGNLQLLCAPCNKLKSDMSDDEARKAFRHQHGFDAGTNGQRRGWFAFGQ